MMKSGLFFDVDGTLIDSRADLATAVNLTRLHYGLSEYAEETVVGFVGDGIKNLALRSFRELPESEQAGALELLRRFYAEHEVEQTVLYPGVSDGLVRLKSAGFSLAVFTNKPTPDALHILDVLGIADYFDEIIGAGMDFPIKPAPDAIFHLLAKFNLNRQTSWMLGDNHTDMAAARQAGVRRGYAAWGFGSLRGEGYDAEFCDFPAFVRAMMLNLNPAD